MKEKATYVNESHSVLLQRNRRSSRSDEHNPSIRCYMLRYKGLGQCRVSSQLLWRRIGGEVRILSLEEFCRGHDLACDGRWR